MIGGLYKEQKEEAEDSDSLDTGIVIPLEAYATSDALLDAVRDEHRSEMEESEKQGRPKKQKRGGVICCCGVPNCRVGPFVETEGK